jgi:hypothetical protein
MGVELRKMELQGAEPTHWAFLSLFRQISGIAERLPTVWIKSGSSVIRPLLFNTRGGFGPIPCSAWHRNGVLADWQNRGGREA